VSTMDAVTLCECFARDGLQHEAAFVPTAAKRALVERFARVGFPRVEATSYSNPKVVAAVRRCSDLLRSLERKSGVYYKATCANLRAVERALGDLDAGCGANEGQPGWSRHRKPLAAKPQPLARRAMAEHRRHGARGAGSLSPHRHRVGRLRLPVRGRVDPGSVTEDVQRFYALGVEHVALGRHHRHCHPTNRARALPETEARRADAHFHDTRGTGLVNYVAAYEAGVRWFDSAFGCRRPSGEGQVRRGTHRQRGDGGPRHLFESMGIATGIDLDALMATPRIASRRSGASSTAA